MVNIKKVISLMAISSVLGLSCEIVNSLNGTANVANAATAWHKGAPKAMIGNWQYKIHSKSASGNWGEMVVWNNKSVLMTQGNSEEFAKIIKYKYLGNEKYLVKKTEKFASVGSGTSTLNMKIKMSNNNKKLAILSEGGYSEASPSWHKTSSKNMNLKPSTWRWPND